MKVLIVEDDKNLNEAIRTALESEFTVFSALDGESAKNIAYRKKPDVILLDIMLPDAKGYKLIEFFKNISRPIIIMISALEEERTRRLAYEEGADDYMIKPITLFELKYKLVAIKKRINIDNSQIIVGDIVLNLDNNELVCQNNVVILQHSQVTVLKMLYKKYKDNEVLSKNEIINCEGERNSINFRIHTVISRLRKNLALIGSEKVIIDNEYGVGYRLVVMK